MAKGKMKLYASYMHRDQDPAVGMVLDALDGSGRAEKEVAGGKQQVSRSTLRNWRTKKTKRPQHCTLAAVAGEVGKVFTLRDKPK